MIKFECKLDFELGNFSDFEFWPESHTRLQWKSLIKEVLVIFKWKLTCFSSFTVKQVSKNEFVNLIYKWFRTELRSFSHFKILTKIAYPDLTRKLENWLFLEFLFIHCKTFKVSKNDQIQMQTWFTSGFLMNGTELRSFSHFQNLTWIAYSDLSRNLENWLILMFAFIPCETVKVSEDDQIRI